MRAEVSRILRALPAEVVQVVFLCFGHGERLEAVAAVCFMFGKYQ